MKKLSIATMVAVLAALLVATVAFAMFTNGNFENGDFTGWTKDLANKNGGIVVGPPASYTNAAGPSIDDMFIVNTTWMDTHFGAGVTCDPNTNGNVCLPFAGSDSAVVNYLGKLGNLNRLTQAGLVGSVLGADGKYHIYFAYAPVLDKGTHSATDQPFMYVKLTRVRAGSPDKVLFDKFSYPDDGNPNWRWNTSTTSIAYMNWQVYDLKYEPTELNATDTLTIDVVAAGCIVNAGGHWGYIYVDDFGVVKPPASTGPSLTSLTPGYGPTTGGTLVTLTGSGFTTANSVTIGGTTLLAGSFTIVNDTTITFLTPASAAIVVDIAVSNPGGSAVIANGFAYYEVPTITGGGTGGGTAPNTGPVTGGTSVVITGTGLAGGAFTFGGTTAECIVNYAGTQATCTSPAHLAGVVDVVVTNPVGSSTSTGGFTYYEVPTITGGGTGGGVSPNIGSTLGGTSITITGTFLTGGTFTIDGLPLVGCTVNPAGTQATCTTPAHAAGPVDVVVNTPNGTATSTGGFTYLATSFNLIVPAGTYTYTSGGTALNIATGLTATSTPAGGTIDGAIAVVGAGFQAGDTLAATDSGGVTSSYNAGTGVLTLSGVGIDISVYQTVLGTVKFSTSSTNTTARTVTYSLGTALPYGATGHFFEFVSFGTPTWGASNTAASARTYFGRTGYLATMNDAGENTFAATKIGGSGAWVGGSDAATEGTWQWVTGPEAGTTFCLATYAGPPPTGSCPAEAGWYQNWNTGEPNDSGNEDYLQFLSGGTGKWNDLNGTSTPSITGYVVEYGGMGGDIPMTIQGSVTVNVINVTIGSILPNTGPTGGGTSVVITGMGLTGGTVTFGGTAATCTVNSDTQITCTSPAHSAGAVDVVVTTPSGPATSTGGFTYLPATLTVTASGPATVKPGEQYVYTFAYTTNVTPFSAEVLFTLPGHTTYVSNTGGYVCAPAAGVVTCTIGAITTNDSFTVTVLVDKLKKINTPLALSMASYSISDNGAAVATGLANVTANTLTPFADVNLGYWALDYIQSIWAYGITGGCIGTPLTYCPEANITRAEMAVFIERGMHGSTFVPGTPTLTFTDTDFAKYWIEALKADGVTAGCGGTYYCPGASITRSQMAVFLLRGKHGPTYLTPPATGLVFNDVASGDFAAGWIEQLHIEGITAGCGSGNFCPNAFVTRAEMAIFVEVTFNLPMPTP